MGDSDADNIFHQHNIERYDLNSKIMLTAIISLSLVVVLVAILHFYARWHLRRQARRRAALSSAALTHPSMVVIIPEPPKTGLDPAMIATFPMFPFKQADETTQTECAICLSVLENDDMVRILPNCKHIFHAECVDKWLISNATCPICRSQAEPSLTVELVSMVQPSAPQLEYVNSMVTIVEGSTSENANQNHGKIGNGSSSRLNSFRRILSIERSSCRIRSCDQEAGSEDLERQ